MHRLPSNSVRPRILLGMLLGLGCGALLASLEVGGAFDAFDRQFLDLRYRLRGERRGSERIVLIEVDDATIGQFEHRWPLPRDLFALLLDALGHSGAAAIGVDVLFLGPSAHDPEHDLLLAAVTAQNPRVVHSIMVLEKGRAPALEAVLSEEEMSVLARHGQPIDGSSLSHAGIVSVPFDALLNASPGLGHIAVSIDPDGVVRRAPLAAEFHDMALPSLALRLAAMARDPDRQPQLRAREGMLEIEWPDGEILRVPIDSEGATTIYFAGGRDAFQRFSMLQVLSWYKSGQLPRLHEVFGGKIVLIGVTGVREVATDVGATPLADATPLMYVHANALDALLGERFLKTISRPIWVMTLLCAGTAIGALVALLNLPLAALVSATALILAAGLVQLLFHSFRLDVPPSAFLLLPPVAYVVVSSYRYLFLERRSRERERELETARTIQRDLLPRAPVRVPGLDVVGFNLPAREVGGDYYDFVQPDEHRVVLALGDVSGKGVPAALLMSHLHGSLHAEVGKHVSPKDTASAMDRALFAATEPGRYATFFIAAFTPRTGEFVFCNAGHPPALLVHGAHIEMLGATGVPLGMFDRSSYKEERRRLEASDFLVIYSDGVTEAARKGEFYGEERLVALVQRLSQDALAADAIVAAILDDVRRFTHDDLHGDDVTLVVARRPMFDQPHPRPDHSQ